MEQNFGIFLKSYVSMCLSACAPNTGTMWILYSLQRWAFTVAGAENRSFRTPRNWTLPGKSPAVYAEG